MAERSRPRRVVGSRSPTGRPRQVAGQRPAAEEPVVESVSEAPEPGNDEGPPDPPERPTSRGRVPGGGRTTIALVVALVLLLAIGTAEVVYLMRDDTPTVSTERPVVTGELTHRAAVEAAARSTEEILSTTYENYDEQVEQAAAKMTDTFAEQYRETAEGIEERFVDRETRLQVEAVGQSVVQASPEQVQALLFLNQYVEKVERDRPTTDFAQYRALVTVVHTDHGWLVSNIETK